MFIFRPATSRLRTQSNLDVGPGAVSATNEAEGFSTGALPCTSPLPGDPRQRDVVV